MLQRLVFRVKDRLPVESWMQMTDSDFRSALLACVQEDSGTDELFHSLFGHRRALYKRFAQFSYFTAPEVHQRLAHRPFSELVTSANRLGEKLAKRFSMDVGADEVLIDAPPVKLEIQFRLDIQSGPSLLPLAELSPVVKALATEQFDKYVKMVRVFVSPRIRNSLVLPKEELAEMLMDCLE